MADLTAFSAAVAALPESYRNALVVATSDAYDQCKSYFADGSGEASAEQDAAGDLRDAIERVCPYPDSPNPDY